ncbi:MAG: ABC transporter permease subunit [Rhodobacteraceae bacterium]|nr:ABC transporter permease subunit [Paracoccaceae bacterium]
MAQRVVQISTSILYLLVFAMPILGLATYGGVDLQFTAADIAAIRFTVLQAILSAALSVALAISASRALARQNFKGREVLISILSAPFILPVIVAISGVLFIFGREGVFNQFLGSLGQETVSIYGLSGILLVHVFFNLPLAIRILLFGWGAIPIEHHRVARGLKLNAWTRFKIIELPMLVSRVPAATAIIFVICLSSFAVALLLGGGPRATTVELAIYQAFRFDFDIAKAGQLALVQTCFAAVAIIISFAVMKRLDVGIGYLPTEPMGHSRTVRMVDLGMILMVAIFMLAPILAVYINPFDVTLLIVVLLNAVLAVPFTLRLILPEIQKSQSDFGRLSRTMRMSAWGMWAWVILPRLFRPLGFSFGLALALSLGDLGVIVLLGSPEKATLPYQIMQLRTGYRLDSAAGASMLLLMMCLFAIVTFDGLGRRYAKH